MAISQSLPVSAHDTLANTPLLNIDIEETTANGQGDGYLETIDYWTTLLRRNLSTAQVLHEAGSEDGKDGLEIDEEVMNAPRRKSAREYLAIELAARLYPAPPDSFAPIIKYEKDVVMLRNM